MPLYCLRLRRFNQVSLNASLDFHGAGSFSSSRRAHDRARVMLVSIIENALCRAVFIFFFTTVVTEEGRKRERGSSQFVAFLQFSAETAKLSFFKPFMRTVRLVKTGARFPEYVQTLWKVYRNVLIGKYGWRKCRARAHTRAVITIQRSRERVYHGKTSVQVYVCARVCTIASPLFLFSRWSRAIW